MDVAACVINLVNTADFVHTDYEAAQRSGGSRVARNGRRFAAEMLWVRHVGAHPARCDSQKGITAKTPKAIARGELQRQSNHGCTRISADGVLRTHGYELWVWD